MQTVLGIARAILSSLLFFGMGLTACGKLTEPAQPSALVDSAVIRTPTPLLVNGRDLIAIKRIDGREKVALDYKWVVEPGRHEVEVEGELLQPGAFRDQALLTRIQRVLTVDVSAGGEYIVQLRQKGEEVFVWVENGQTGELVAGERPEELLPEAQPENHERVD